MKIFVLLCLVCVVFGQFMPTEMDYAKVNAKKYGLMNPEEYFSGRKDFEKIVEKNSKDSYIYHNQKEYITYVNVSIIEIAEEKAAKMKLKDYDGFVRQIRNEPNITLERVDAFRRNGNYIPEYEKYIKDKETKKTFIFW